MITHVKVISGNIDSISKVIEEAFKTFSTKCCCEEKPEEPEVDIQKLNDAQIYVESIDRLRKKLKVDSAFETCNFLDRVAEVNKMASFNIILKEIAIIIDKKYPDHIRNSEEIFSISSLNGKIVRVKNINKIKTFKNFAAFRNIEDARTACRILSSILKGLFGGE